MLWPGTYLLLLRFALFWCFTERQVCRCAADFSLARNSPNIRIFNGNTRRQQGIFHTILEYCNSSNTLVKSIRIFSSNTRSQQGISHPPGTGVKCANLKSTFDGRGRGSFGVLCQPATSMPPTLCAQHTSSYLKRKFHKTSAIVLASALLEYFMQLFIERALDLFKTTARVFEDNLKNHLA